ncbi:butyrophilin subfamily 1 member A1-like [Talpa occidentalis]|uniref:butyrophilin subfamily 1 member A1-like n=1 Tax=Talpa occidentalis TaxID=50954 RepID=UPI0023F9D070|nr:butyrophilin subfamily 1 member A1-like [Talpa occidentalis]
MDAQNMEVKWYRTHPSGLVHRYGASQDHMEHQMSEYQGRTQLLTENITKGQVTLRIRSIYPLDDGEYRCIFESSTYYNGANVEVLVTERDLRHKDKVISWTLLLMASLSSPLYQHWEPPPCHPGSGAAPHIHIKPGNTKEVKLTCTSTGWFPEPQVQWRDQQGQLLAPDSETIAPEGNGLFGVKTSITVDESSKDVTCLIRNPVLSEEKEVHISVADALLPWSYPWMVLFAVLLPVLVVAATFGAVYAVRARKAKELLTAERDKLMKEKEEIKKEKDELSNELDRRIAIGVDGLNKARKSAANILLDENTAHPHLLVSHDGKTVTSLPEKQNLPDNPKRLDSLEAVLGQNSFSSGEHYWEVCVAGKNRWAIGLCEDSIPRKGQYISARPENGLWTLSLKNGQLKALGSPRFLLHVPEPLLTVGIFLQYEKGLISFYNVTDCTILYTFKSNFKKSLKPYFYPGPPTRSNRNGLTILQVEPVPSKSLMAEKQ